MLSLHPGSRPGLEVVQHPLLVRSEMESEKLHEHKARIYATHIGEVSIDEGKMFKSKELFKCFAHGLLGGVGLQISNQENVRGRGTVERNALPRTSQGCDANGFRCTRAIADAELSSPICSERKHCTRLHEEQLHARYQGYQVAVEKHWSESIALYRMEASTCHLHHNDSE